MQMDKNDMKVEKASVRTLMRSKDDANAKQ